MNDEKFHAEAPLSFSVLRRSDSIPEQSDPTITTKHAEIMRGIIFSALILCLITGARCLEAATSSKEALLIANNDYTRLPQLSNPVSDGKILGETLRNLGFRVTLLTNASREDMLDAIQGFEERLRSSHGIAFFHYGGHGIQVDGSNYLIPANADISDNRKLKTRAVDLEEVMTSLDEAGADANIIVLDACRNNPLPKGTRSLSRGLAVVQTKPKNSIIVYAADAGHEARDGVFTPELAKELTIPGISFQKALLEVRKKVTSLTGNEQTPADYSQLTEELVLNSGQNNSPGDLQTIAPSHANDLPPSRVKPVVMEPVAPSVSQNSPVNPPPETAYSQSQTPSSPPQSSGAIPGITEFFKSWVDSWCSNDPQVQVQPFADVVD